MIILKEFTLYEVPMQDISRSRRILGRVSPHEATRERSEFVLYCDDQSHPEVVAIVRAFLVWTFGGPPVVLTIGGQTVVEDEPVLVDGKPVSAVGDVEELYDRLKKEGRSARSRFELRCQWCRDRAGPSEAAPVVVLKETLSGHLQKLAGYGMSRLSLTGLRYILY